MQVSAGSSFSLFASCAITSALVLVLAADSRSQTAPAFGTVTFGAIPPRTTLQMTAYFNRDRIPDVLFFNQSLAAVQVMVGNGDGTFRPPQSLCSVADASYLTAADFNADSIPDIIIVHREANDIEVLLSNAGVPVYTSKLYHVNYYPEHVVLADLNNDGKMDILSFGKLSAGMSVLLGNGRGGFQSARTILPDVPASEVAVLQLNGDGIPDLAVHNWLTNELIFYSGLGTFRFAEQSRLPFGEDSTSAFFGDWNGDGLDDFGTVNGDDGHVRLYINDGLATFSLMQYMRDAHHPHTVVSAVLSLSGYPDLFAVSQKDRSLCLYPNRGGGLFGEESVYGLQSPPTIVLAADWNGDGWIDVMCIDQQSGTLEILWNGRTPYLDAAGQPIGKREVSFATGRAPLGLTVADFNEDGLDDIAVVNHVSSGLSLYINSIESGFQGQMQFPSVESPVTVRTYARTDTNATLLLTHDAIPKVSILQFSTTVSTASGKYATTMYAIPTAGAPRIFLPDATLQDSVIEFYVSSGAKQNALSYFKQVRGSRFLERSLKPVIPSKILAAAVSDFNDDGRPDLAYVFYDADSSCFRLGVTLCDTLGEYRSNTRSMVLGDSTIFRCSLLFEDLNGDNSRDCILYTAPANAIRVALGLGDGIFGTFSTIADGVSLSMPEQLQI
ncbi:MAG: VCBS repeat-containing protein, partial [Ignavibacteriales bacterium]|nr:VCBS repeat-containing protein [Ignavibacteriales bacterium]